MAHFSMKLITYDPSIIAAFERLRKNRKHAAFTQEALKHFLATEKGEQVLLLMEGKISEHSLTSTLLVKVAPSEETPFGLNGITSHSYYAQQCDSNTVLDNILK